MIRTAFVLEIRRSRALVGWLGLLLVAYGALMSAFYPILRENTALLEDYLKVFPKALMAAFGMEGPLTDPGVFFTTYVASWIWPIMAGLGAILIATRPVAADTERGFIEMPLASPLPRAMYLLLAILAQVAALVVLAIAAVAGMLVVGIMVGAGFDPWRFALAGAASFLFAAAIAGPTMVLSVATLNRGVAGAMGAGALVAMYLLDVIAKIQPDLAPLGQLSLMHYFRTTPIIDTGVLPPGDMAVLGCVAIAGWAAAVWLFQRRDLAT